MKTIDVTPAAFNKKSNPNALKNITKANAAAQKLEKITLQRSDFLRNLVEEEFGSIENLANAYKKLNPQGNESLEVTAAAADIVLEYNRLIEEQAKAQEALLEAFAGK